MEAVQIKIDGKDVLRDGMSGIYYTQKEWRNWLQVSDASNSKASMHGREVSETRAEVRVIPLAGIIDRIGNDYERTATEYLEQLFALNSNPATPKVRELYVKDIYDREWILPVKVKEPCAIKEWNADFKGSHWEWMAILESVGDPTYLSYGEYSASWIEGAFGWWEIPSTWLSLQDGFSLSDILHAITINPSGNTGVYPRFTITTTGSINSPIKIRNIETNEWFSLDVSWVTGDIIVIDSSTQTCSKNGVDITSSRISGSTWPTAQWSTRFLIDDGDGGSIESDFTVIISYKNALL